MLEPRDLVVGTLSGGVTAVVRAPGVVEPVGVAWHVEWWIGAEDRWHRPAVEATTRQRSLPTAPVVETAVRVPGGDITARIAGVIGPGATPWTLIEVTNRSAVPVALGWTVRGGPTGLGPGVLHRVDGRRVVLGRAPRSIEMPSELISGSDDLTGAVAVQPLAHTAVGWLAIEGTDEAVGAARAEDLPTFPPLDRVIAGWSPFEETGARMTVGDDTAQQLVDADRAVVRLAGGVDLDPSSASLVVRAAALLSADAVASDHIAVLGELQRRNGAVRADDELAATIGALRAWCAVAWRRMVDPDDVVLPIAAAATWLSKHARRSTRRRSEVMVAVTEAVATLATNDQASAASRLAGGLDGGSDGGSDGGPAAGSIPAGSGRSTPSGAAIDSVPDTAAVARRVLVEAAERFGRSVDTMIRIEVDGIAVLPGWHDTWWGRAIDAHDLPTPWGSMSFALRWHGERPALLWEVLGAPPGLRVTAPALDPGWRSTGAAGEELLGAIERPILASFS